MIVKGYVVQHRVRPDQISDLITSVNQALGQVGPELLATDPDIRSVEILAVK